MLTTRELILEYVCPGLGIIVSTYLFTAPVKDCYVAVKAGKGLGDLNPTPWAFCTGNCIGWITYGVLKQNVFLLIGNAVGFILSIWLNMQAAKLQYEGFRSKMMIAAILKSLEQPESPHLDTMDAAQPKSTGDMSNSGLTTRSVVTVIREMEAQSASAPASHDALVLINVVLWLVIISIVCYATSIASDVKELAVGIIVNLNFVVFCASPLSIVWTVLVTRNSATIHIPTTLGVTMNGAFWCVYGLAVLDAFIAVPNGLGALLGFIQIALCVIFPRHSKAEAPTVESEARPQTAASLASEQESPQP